MKRFGIRADASLKLGMGHIMRCVSIGCALRERGFEVVFFIENEYPAEILRKQGFAMAVLPEGGYGEAELYGKDDPESGFLEILKKSGCCGLLVDSYFAEDPYLETLKRVLPVIYIDGLYRSKADIAGVLNYNAAASEEEFRERFRGTRTELMIGLDYVPLRPEFRQYAAQLREGEAEKASALRKAGGEAENRPVRVLLTTGAADTLGVVEPLTKMWCADASLPSCEFHVVLGSLYRSSEEFRAFREKLPRFVFHENVSDMLALMKETDLAVCAAGTTVYELLAARVPTISFAIADIQLTFSRLVPAVVWAGDLRDRGGEETGTGEKNSFPGNSFSAGKAVPSSEALVHLTDLLRTHAEMPERRRELSERAAQLFDGRGAERIAAKLSELAAPSV